MRSLGIEEVVGVDRALRRGVLERLVMLDEMARQDASSMPASMARTQIRRTIDGWRAVLRGHQPDAGGRCPICSGWLRRRKWPCHVWTIAHRQLIGEGHETQPPAAPPRHPLRRPREVEVVGRGTRAAVASHTSHTSEPSHTSHTSEPSHTPDPSDAVTTSGGAGTGPGQASQASADSIPVHRAAVIERHPVLPRPRVGRRPRM